MGVWWKGRKGEREKGGKKSPSLPRSLAPFLSLILFLLLLVQEGAAQPYSRQIDAVPVRDAGGAAYAHPWLGGLNVPRPQFADLDADGDLDLFVQERTGQLIFFENTGTPQAPRFAWRTDALAGLDVGEWARLADLDADGDLDVLAEQPFSFVRLYRNTGTPQAPRFEAVVDTLAATYLDDAGALRDTLVFSDRQNLPALADVDCDGRLDLFVATTDGFLTYYANLGAAPDGLPLFRFVTDRYQDISIIGEFGKRPRTQSALRDPKSAIAEHGANAIAFADVDADGDVDLFWGDFFSPSLYFLANTGACETPVLERTSDVFPVAEPLMTSGFNAPAFADLDADGDVDLFVGVLGGAFPAGPHAPSNFYFFEHTPGAVPAFAVQTRQFIASLDVGEESRPAFADLDADGDLDLALGNRIDPLDTRRANLFFFRNEGTPGAPAFRLETHRLVDLADLHFNTAPAFADLDADGDLDLLVGSFDGTLAHYRNDGTPADPVFGAAETLAYTTVAGRTRTLDVGQNSTPALADLDADGDFDLLVGEASGVVNLYRNAGTPAAADFVLLAADSLAAAGLDAGARSAPFAHDLDADGRLELVVGTAEEGLRVYRNGGTPQAPAWVFEGPFEVPGTVPRQAVPAFADLDADGDADVFVGGLQGGLFFYRNDRIRVAADDRPEAPPVPLQVVNYPNPLRAATTFAFRLAEAGRVRLVVYDVLGRAVAVPVERFLPPGDHRVRFDAASLPVGVYLYALTSNAGTTATGTMMRVR